MKRIGALIGAGYGQTVSSHSIDEFMEMTRGMYGAAGYELIVGLGPEADEGAVDVKLTIKVNGDSAFLGWDGELYAIEPGRSIPHYIEVDMVAEIDHVDSFKVETNQGAIIDLARQHMTVSRDTALAAVREYVATGNRPVGLDWESLPQDVGTRQPRTP